MKCEACGYVEEVPLQTPLNLRDLKEDEERKRDMVLCQFSLNYTYPVDDTILKQ